MAGRGGAGGNGLDTLSEQRIHYPHFSVIASEAIFGPHLSTFENGLKSEPEVHMTESTHQLIFHQIQLNICFFLKYNV